MQPHVCVPWRLPLTCLFRSGKIARGAAYATANIVSNEGFLRRGAAFGLQMLERATKGERKYNKIWNDTVDFLLDYVNLSLLSMSLVRPLTLS